ncbi:helix-turn-helix domain-containing protein [Salinifilum ghardaiensis]
MSTRWRRLEAGQQALLVVAYLRKGETYTDLAIGFDIGVTTVLRDIHEALQVLAARSRLDQAIAIAVRKAFVLLDGTLLQIDRVGLATGRDRLLQEPRNECPVHRGPGRTPDLNLARATESSVRHGRGT